MAATEFILVPVYYSRPFNGIGSMLLESKMIAYAVQEYFLPTDADDVDGTGYRSAELYEDGAIPVVHLFLKNDSMVVPYTGDVNQELGDGLPIMPPDRPTDIWVEGFMEDFYGIIMGVRPPAEIPELGMPLIDYYTEVVTDTTIEFDITPVANADTYYVSMNGEFIQDAVGTNILVSGLDESTDYVFVIQARKSNLTYKYSQLNVQVITTTAAPAAP